jgi:hypothetical protein
MFHRKEKTNFFNKFFFINFAYKTLGNFFKEIMFSNKS